MNRITPREANVEEELYHLFRNVLEKHNNEIEKVKLSGIEPQYPVDGKKADLMLLESASKPLLVIECKRKVDTGRGIAVFTEFDPMSSKVIDQALYYATHTGAPLFATTNGKVFALFLAPERGEPFRIDRHRLLIREIQLNEQVADEILTLAARWKAGLAITKTPVDWAFILRLRSFVEYLSSQILPLVEKKMKVKLFKEEFERFSREVGGGTPMSYARESAYILMNKIVFHKILERYYGDLVKLKPCQESNGKAFASYLEKHFVEAMFATKDFEPVFSTGIYDQAPLPDEQIVLDEINSFIEDMETYRLEEVGSDVVGFIYERLIPEQERHRLGQFYTPPQIAELITRWAVRESSDKVLDPACGSGTFLVKAYGILRSLKAFETDFAHKEVLSQIFAVDINPFPAHLTAVNLAMRDVQHPTSEMNVIVDDFFHLGPGQKSLTPYRIKTLRGELRRELVVPVVDVVVGNPPYTRWLEIADSTKKAINASVGTLLREYGLQAKIRSGVETSIHIPFVFNASKFLRGGGRLGMIVSNSWLQTDYGINFGRFLLENFKVRAIIDFASRLFTIPTVATCVILLEKPETAEEAQANKTVFLYVDKEASVDEVLEAIERPKRGAEKFLATEIVQSKLPRNEKWLSSMFQLSDVNNALAGMSEVADFFNVTRGNIEYSASKSRGLGANEFFYLEEKRAKKWGLAKALYPLVTSSRYTKFFSFSRKDWEKLRAKGSPCYLFLTREPRTKLEKSAAGYVKWGETECKVWYDDERFSYCSQTQACKEREANRTKYKGWYDVGGVAHAAFFTGYYGRYLRRFISLETDIALDADFIAFTPKVSLTKTQTKAILAFLNSTFNQLYVETHGRVPAGVGPVALEVPQAQKMPIPDVRKLSTEDVEKLANLFDQLESSARRLDSAGARESAESLTSAYTELDEAVADILGVGKKMVAKVGTAVKLLMDRRLSKKEEPRPEAISGEQASGIRPPKKIGRGEETELSTPLDKWT